MTGTESAARLLRGIRADGGALSLDEHDACHGPLPPAATRRQLLDLVERSGLVGRGGAGFPLHRKLRAVNAAAAGGTTVVVANGCEGEPASEKDRVLLLRTPHLVLDGAIAAGAAIGSDRVVLAVGDVSLDVVRTAIAERRAVGRDAAHVEAIAVPDRFVSGQESALVDFLNGGPGRPRPVPPRPSESGVGRRPTLVSNVETLAHLALLCRRGAEWFRAVGSGEEPGSTLVTLRGAVRSPGVYEVARASSLASLIASAGGRTGGVGPALIGGYAGAWLAADAAAGCALGEPELAAAGGVLGAGVVILLDPEDCGLVATARILGYLAAETAGQCGPCVHGLAAMAGGLADLAAGRCRRDVAQRLENWAWQVSGRGACRHPDGAARLVSSALSVFVDDVVRHRRGEPCRAATTPRWDASVLPNVPARAPEGVR